MLVAAGAAVALTACALPSAKRYTNQMTCTQWHHGRCVAYKRLTSTARRALTGGYAFGPRYATRVPPLPRTMSAATTCSPNYRYVYANGYIYQVDPTTYAVSA